MNYLLIIPIAFILAAAALALPWFMVRQGYREQVQLGGACTTVLGLAASTGVFSYAIICRWRCCTALHRSFHSCMRLIASCRFTCHVNLTNSQAGGNPISANLRVVVLRLI
ncbi:hypothetical protein [Escherichia coli]|uniref:hypothetical protein n=1 Tax=Escherichia coli TaxID=562 RepID=UPI001FDAC07B|nr:hypothetical protein [Escherichia coli]